MREHVGKLSREEKVELLEVLRNALAEELSCSSTPTSSRELVISSAGS